MASADHNELMYGLVPIQFQVVETLEGWWCSGRLQHLQQISKEDIAVLHLTINLYISAKMQYSWKINHIQNILSVDASHLG